MKPETTYPAIIGRILARKRDERGRDQDKLAKAAGLNRSSLSRIENGETIPDAVQLTQIARALKTTPSDILAEADAAHARLKMEGVKVHMKKPASKSGKVGLGLALIGAAALGGLVASALAKDEKSPDKLPPPQGDAGGN